MIPPDNVNDSGINQPSQVAVPLLTRYSSVDMPASITETDQRNLFPMPTSVVVSNNQALATKIEISRINSVLDTSPTLVTTTWGQFVTACKKPVIRGPLPIVQFHASEKSIRDKQKDGIAIISGTYCKPNSRMQDDLNCLSLVTLDLDDGYYSFDALCNILTGFEAVVLTSYSHSFDKSKFRVFLLLKQPIKMEIKPVLCRIIDFMENRIGDHIDQACRKPGQAFFTPSCPPGGEDLYQFCHIQGMPIDPEDFPAPPEEVHIKRGQVTGLRPGDDYNNRGSWTDLLTSLGWTPFYTKNSVTHWTRPGKRSGISCSVFDTGILYCHTSAEEAAPFKIGTAYSLFAAFSQAYHNGDFKAAAKDLANKGYGEPDSRTKTKYAAGFAASIPTGVVCDLPDLVTDQRLKYYFCNKYKNNVQFVPGIGWHLWDGTRWSTNTPGGLYPNITRMLHELLHESEKISNDSDRMVFRKALIGIESHLRQNAIIQACQHVPQLITDANRLDIDTMLLNCQNGTVDLNTGVRKDHDPADLITRIINIDYDSSALCPTFLEFISWAMQDDMELVAYLQRFIGYCLTGKTTEQILNFWYGSGGNGKSTLMNVLQWLLCDYAATADSSLIMKRSNGNDGNRLAMLASLRGARFVTLSEVNDGEKLDEAAIKSFTGGDTITCRNLYQSFISFIPQSKFVGFGNYKPHIRGTDHGIWRRIHLVPFNAVISEDSKDPLLPDKLRAELSGILAWAVRGCLEWQNGGLVPPAAIRDAVEQYREAEDVFRSWLNECCSLGENERTSAAELIASFKDYSGWRLISDKKFGEMLRERNFQKIRSNGIYWAGISVV